MTDELPHDLRAEQAAVGAAIQSTAALTDVTAIVPPGGWYRHAHETIVDAATAVAERGQVDPTLVAAELDSRGQLKRVGGAPYLFALTSTATLGINAGYYAEIVAAKARLRTVIETGQRLVQMGMAGQDDPDEALDRARAELDVAVDGGHTPDELWEGLLDRVVDSYDQDYDPGLPTPWPDVDDLIGGLAPGCVTVIGARPGVGKSVLAGNIAAHTAASGIRTLLHSLEMPREEVVHRLIAAEATVDYAALRNHRLDAYDWPNVSKAQRAMRDMPLTIDDRGTIGIPAIRARARDLARADLGLIVIDYLQLVSGPDPRAPREQQVAAVSRSLKLLARDLAVPVVALSQVNRAQASRAQAKPRLEDLRESGAIENDADAVLLLHIDPVRPGELQVEVAKNRHGATGHVALQWSPRFARARSLATGVHA